MSEKQEKKIEIADMLHSRIVSVIFNTILFAIFLYGSYLIYCNWGSVDLSDWRIYFENKKMPQGCIPNIRPDIGETFNRIYEGMIQPILNESIMVICNVVLYLVYNISRFQKVKREQVTYSWGWYIVTIILPVLIVVAVIAGVFFYHYIRLY